MVNLLLNLKLDPNLKDKRNRSPLDDALRFQHSRVSSILKSLSEKSSPDLAPSKPRRAKKSVDVQVRNFQNMDIFISIFRPTLTSNDLTLPYSRNPCIIIPTLSEGTRESIKV